MRLRQCDNERFHPVFKTEINERNDDVKRDIEEIWQTNENEEEAEGKFLT